MEIQTQGSAVHKTKDGRTFLELSPNQQQLNSFVDDPK